MLKYCLFSLFLSLVAVSSPGCGGGSNSSALENADQAAIDEYQRIEAEAQANDAQEMKGTK